jgi:hypothetical protein
VNQHRAVREPGRVDALRVDAVVRVEAIQELVDERDVVDAAAHRGAAAVAGVPAPEYALGVDDEVLLLAQRRQSVEAARVRLDAGRTGDGRGRSLVLARRKTRRTGRGSATASEERWTS